MDAELRRHNDAWLCGSVRDALMLALAEILGPAIPTSWLRVRRGVRMAAWLARGGELHHLNTCSVGIVGVQPPFAVATYFRAVEPGKAVFVELVDRRVNIRNAEREMILHPEFFVVGVRGDVEHVLDPVRAVGDLNLVPIETIVFESTLPVEPEAQQVDIEFVFSRDIPHHEAGVNQVGANPVVRDGEVWVGFRAVNKLERVSLRIAELKMSRAVVIL